MEFIITIYHSKMYHGITTYHNIFVKIFSQPKANYAIERIILMYAFIATHCMKYIFRLFMTAAVIVILVNTVLIRTAYRLVYQV